MNAMPATLLLPDLARRHALDRPFAPAVLDGDALWSWAELDRRATSIGAALTSRGLGPGDSIGLVIGGTALGIAALHGVPRAGVDVVLVHPRLSRPEIAALLEVAGCRALIVDPSTGIAASPGIERINLGEVIDAGTRALPPAPETTAAAETTAKTTGKTTEFIVPTSGTTAHPKLARLPLDRLAASAAAWNAVLPEATGWLLSLGLAHVAGLGIVSRAAAAGVPIVVLPDLDAGALLATVDAAA